MPDIYKIRISKAGYPITDTNIAHIAFDSDINTFKIKSTNSVTLTVGDGSLEIAHGLGYSPAFLAWFEVDGNGKWFPVQTKEDISGKGVTLYVASNATNIVVSWLYDSTPSSLKVFYQLIVDPVE